MSVTLKEHYARLPRRITSGQIQIADRWHLVRVAANKVLFTAGVLRDMRLTVYAPMQQFRKRQGRNRVKMETVDADHPAFFNYMFVGFRNRADWWAMFETGLVRAIVVVGDRPVTLTQGQIAKIAIRQLTGGFDFRDPKMRAAFAVKPGETVRVVNDRHVLYGREYTARTVEDGRVGVLLDFLGKMQFYELAIDDLEKTK